MSQIESGTDIVSVPADKFSLEIVSMNIFFKSLRLAGLLCTLSVLHSVTQAQEIVTESLPEPLSVTISASPRKPLVDTSSVEDYRRNRLEIEAANRANRMERARRLSEARTELDIAQLYAGYQPLRPSVNAGYIFNAPPVRNYRWMNMYRPAYGW